MLADQLRIIMSDMKVENGLTALGYTQEDIPGMVAGTVPQAKLHKNIDQLKCKFLSYKVLELRHGIFSCSTDLLRLPHAHRLKRI